MDIEVILGNGDACGLVFYISMYSTKSTRTVGTILPPLADAASRLQKEGGDSPSSERAREIVQSGLCKVLSGTDLGVPAAVCKIMGWSDSIKSRKPILCRTRAVMSWIRSSRAEKDPRRKASSGNESSEDEVFVTAHEGCLAVWMKAAQDYIHRCGYDDASHPLYERCQRWICVVGCLQEGRRSRGVSTLYSSARLGGEYAVAPPVRSEPTAVGHCLIRPFGHVERISAVGARCRLCC